MSRRFLVALGIASAVFCAVTVSPLPARADWTVCNKTGNLIYGAVMLEYQTPDTFIGESYIRTIGWELLENGACKVAYNGPLSSGSYKGAVLASTGVYAFDDSDGVWGQTTYLDKSEPGACVKSPESFNFVYLLDDEAGFCVAQHRSMRGFLMAWLYTDHRNDVRTTLLPGGRMSGRP